MPPLLLQTGVVGDPEYPEAHDTAVHAPSEVAVAPPVHEYPVGDLQVLEAVASGDQK